MARQRSLFKYYSDRMWGEGFLEGRFRFWSLAYFKDLEDAVGRGDAYEGTAIFQPEGGLQITNETQGTGFTMPGYAFALTVRYDEIFVFCMSRTLSSAL